MNNSLLSILKNWKEEDLSHSLKVVEFFGTPGSGKTYLSSMSYRYFNKDLTCMVSKPSVDIGRMNVIKRIFFKVFAALYLVTVSLATASSVVRLVSEFHSKKDYTLVKLVFNLLYILGVIRFYKNQNRILIMDQGILQSIWSCIFHGNRVSYNLDEILSLLSVIFSKSGLCKLLMVHVNTEEDNIRTRLATRKIKGSSLLNAGDDGAIKRGVATTIEAREFLDCIAKKTPFFSIVDVINN